MKIFVISLFLYISFFVPYDIYAGVDTMNASYPAPNGSYNKLVLQSLTTAPSCSAKSNGVYTNAGMLYMDPATNTLQMCTNDGTAVAVPYPETCFNRFCSWTDTNSQSDIISIISTWQAQGKGNIKWCPLNGCPPGYAWASTSSNPIQDIFTTSFWGGNYYHVESTVCCSCGNNTCTAFSTVNPAN